MKKFKVGDKVRLKNNLEVEKKYGEIFFVSSMNGLKGKEITINGITSQGNYTVEESYFFFSDEMLEKATDNNNDLFEFALEKLNMTKDELEKEYEESKTEKQIVEDVRKRCKDFENYCRCCDDCIIDEFLKRNNMEDASIKHCMLIYEHLFKKEE